MTGQGGPGDTRPSSPHRLLLVVEVDPGDGFAGRVEVVGGQGGGAFAGWIDFMGMVDTLCAAYSDAAPDSGPASTSQGERISSRRESMRSFS